MHMRMLIVKAWVLLLYLDAVGKFRGFSALHAKVEQEPRVLVDSRDFSASAISRAVDIASVFYFKHVLCLQRSAATALLLRKYGWQADMVIGARMIPFASHAWVEIAGDVVNDKPYVREMYQVLKRC